MIERAFARTFRNFSTIFVIVAVVVLPVHLIYSYTFRNVIATSDFHDTIEQIPKYQQVRSVGPTQLDHARLVFLVVIVAELALVPFAVRATRRAFIVDDEGGVPTAPDAWGRALKRQEGRTFRPGWLLPAGIGLLAALVAGALLYGIGAGITGFLSEDWRWVGVGLTQVLAVAGAAPLFLGPLALVRAKAETPSAPKLY